MPFIHAQLTWHLVTVFCRPVDQSVNAAFAKPAVAPVLRASGLHHAIRCWLIPCTVLPMLLLSALPAIAASDTPAVAMPGAPTTQANNASKSILGADVNKAPAFLLRGTFTSLAASMEAPQIPAINSVEVKKPLPVAQMQAPDQTSHQLRDQPHAQVPTVAAPATPLHANVNANANKTAPAAVSVPVLTEQTTRIITPGKEITPRQSIENAYRKALSLHYAGQLPQAIALLENILQQDPKYAAARQSLADFLREDSRSEAAMNRLKEGLALDPSQSDMAMNLARLQVAEGDVALALATLETSLPAAIEQAEYQAFLATLLQRVKRYKEAAAHYAVAVRKSPENGLWWMGYGISLQSDNRPGEAQRAFKQSIASATLTPALQAFVDQKLNSMQR